MAIRSSVGQSAVPAGLRDVDIAASLHQALGLGAPEYESLDDAFYDGVGAIITEWKAGNITEKQARQLIELFVAAYAGATINQQINALFQNWAAGMMGAGGGEKGGRR